MAWEKLDKRTRINSDNFVILSTRDIDHGFDVIGTSICGRTAYIRHCDTEAEVDEYLDKITAIKGD